MDRHMYRFKVRMSYDDDSEDILITENELQHAYYAFLTEKRVVLPTGEAFRGRDIISITVEEPASMGWNKSYTPTAEEWGEIRVKLGNKPKQIMEEHKLIAEIIISNGQVELLGKPESKNLISNDGKLWLQ